MGFLAQKHGVPRDQIGRWLVKEVTRQLLLTHDALREAWPDQEPVALADAASLAPSEPELEDAL